MLENSTPVPPGSEIPFPKQPRAISDSTSTAGSSLKSSRTLSRLGSVAGGVHFGSRGAFNGLDLRSHNEFPGLDRMPQYPPSTAAQGPRIKFTPPNISQCGQIYPQTGYFPSPIDISSLDASIQEKVFVPKTPLEIYGFRGGGELEMNENQFQESEQFSAEERAARLSRIGNFSAPSSAQISPVLDPINTPNPCTVSAGHVQGDGVVDMVPLLDLGGDVETIDTFKKPEARSKITVTKEASDLVRQHTQRGIRQLQARAGTGDATELRSGVVTPVACRNEDYVQPPDHFRGGILGSLLKLYNPPHHERSRHHGYSTASTAVGSPTASGQTTPKWHSKSANTSTTSLGGLLAASGSVLATPAAAMHGKNARPKVKHRPHYGGVVEAIKTFSGKSLEEEIKVRNIYIFFL